MNLRERIADWISGGLLTQARLKADLYDTANLYLQYELDQFRENFLSAMADFDALSHALEIIAAQETPGSNATVRRMARMARDAMIEVAK